MVSNKINFTFKYHMLTWSITFILSGLFLLSNLWGSVKNLGKILLSSPRGLYKARKYMDYSHIY